MLYCAVQKTIYIIQYFGSHTINFGIDTRMEDLPYTYNVILLYENTMLFFSKKNFSGVKDTTFRDLDLWPQ